MAITQTGAAQIFNISTAASGDVSTTITVPGDAEIAVVFISGYRNEANYFSGGAMTFTKGASQINMIAAANHEGDASGPTSFMGAVFYLVGIDTGTNKTLHWDWQGTNTATNAPIIALLFFKGIDTASPVRDSGGAQAGGAPYTSSMLTAVSGDLIVAAACASTASEGTVLTWSGGLTTLQDITFYGQGDMALATCSPSGDTTVGTLTDSAWLDGAIVALVLKPAAPTADPSSTLNIGPQPFSVLSSAVGTFNTSNAAAGNTVTVSGLGFQPDALIFSWTGSNSSSNAVGRGNTFCGVGMVDKDLTQLMFTDTLYDAQTTSNDLTWSLNSAIARAPNTNNTTGKLDIVSVNSDGFVANVIEQFVPSMQVNYLALGGARKLATKISEVLTMAANGVTQYQVATDCFTPAGLLTFSSFYGLGSLASGVTGTGAQLVVGLSDGSKMGSAGIRENNAVNPVNTAGWATNSYFLRNSSNAFYTTVTTQPHAFTLNYVGPGLVIYHDVLGFGNCNAAVGTLQTAINTTNVAITGLSFKPTALLFISGCQTTDTALANAYGNDAKMSIGFCDSALNQRAVSIQSRYNLSPTQVSTAFNYNAVYESLTTAGANDGILQVKSIDANGFTWGMANIESVAARYVYWLALG